MGKREKTTSGLSPETEFAVISKLCDGHDLATVADLTSVDYGFVYQLACEQRVIEQVEAARLARIQRAAATADDTAKAWAEYDKQEREAATALQSAIIQLVPRKAEAIGRRGGKGLDVRMAIEECDKLAGALLKAQKARRIASNRPVETSEVKTDAADVRSELEKLKALIRGDDEGGDECGAVDAPEAAPIAAEGP